MKPDRRQFLQGTGATCAALLGLEKRALWPPLRRTEHVILVAFAGGVRTRETLGTPDNVPNLMRLARDGVVYPRTRVVNLGHFGSSLSLFTGISEARGIRDNVRGEDPTVFEYVRKDTGFEAGDVWISTSGGAQQTNYSYSLHPDYGARYAANAVDGDGIFNDEFKRLLRSYGRPRTMEADERAVFERLRGALGAGSSASGEDQNSSRVQEYLLSELERGTTDLRGPGASDAKALRVAKNLLGVFHPRLLAVVLRDADVGHGSYNSYVEVIRRNDVMLGELWSAVEQDPLLRDKTALFVLPEFGRDADLNQRRGLDHGDGSDDLRFVTTVCVGPEFRRGAVVSSEVRSIDVCPTICDLFGADAKRARGKGLPGLGA